MGRRKNRTVRPSHIRVEPHHNARKKQHTRKYVSLSRWTKLHREKLRRVDFGVPHRDKNWRKTKEYSAWRKAVLRRDTFRCTACSRRTRLSAHHIIPASVAPELRYEVWNGQTLCVDCHDKQEHQHDPAFWIRMITRRPK